MIRYNTLWRGVGDGSTVLYSSPPLPDNISELEIYIDNTQTFDWDITPEQDVLFYVAPDTGSIISMYRVTKPDQLPTFIQNTPVTADSLNSLVNIAQRGIEEAYDIGIDALEKYVDVEGSIESAIAAAEEARTYRDETRNLWVDSLLIDGGTPNSTYIV